MFWSITLLRYSGVQRHCEFQIGSLLTSNRNPLGSFSWRKTQVLFYKSFETIVQIFSQYVVKLLFVSTNCLLCQQTGFHVNKTAFHVNKTAFCVTELLFMSTKLHFVSQNCCSCQQNCILCHKISFHVNKTAFVSQNYHKWSLSQSIYFCLKVYIFMFL